MLILFKISYKSNKKYSNYDTLLFPIYYSVKEKFSLLTSLLSRFERVD